MKKALISPNETIESGYRIAQVVPEEFSVAEPLYWVGCPDTVNENDYFYDPQYERFIKKPEPEVETEVQPRVVPQTVSRFQGRAVLLQAGYLDDVEGYFASPDVDPFEKLAWQDATEFRRNSPLVEAMKPVLGLTEEQLDDLFVFAATIQA